MILTTTHRIEGQNIQSYLGIVTGVEVSMPEQTLSFKMEKYYTNYENKINEVKKEREELYYYLLVEHFIRQ